MKPEEFAAEIFNRAKGMLRPIGTTAKPYSNNQPQMEL
jgi:hypothetical protein